MSRMHRYGRLKWLLLPVETKHREFDAKLWQGCCAAERGYGVVIGDMEEIYEQYLALPRGVVLDKTIEPRKIKTLRRLRRAGYRLCVNDEEALLAYNYPDRYLDSRLNREVMDMTDLYFTWGERQAELIRKAYPEYAERVHTVGTPRVDLLVSELRALYSKEAGDIRDRIGRYILLPSNFCDVLHINGPDFRLKQARSAGLVRNEADVRLHVERRAHRERVLAAFVEALEAMRERFPEHALVVRPHPADDSSQWLRLVAHIDRCHVLHEGTAIPWLLGADAIFHNGCTTAVEAFLLGKRPISYHPFWDDRFEYHFQTKVGAAVDSIEALLGMVDDVIARKAPLPRADNHDLEHYMRTTSEPSAAEATLNMIDLIECRPRRFNYSWLSRGYIHYRALSAGKRLERRFRRLRRRQSTARQLDLLRLQKWPRTTLEEVETQLAKFQELTGRFSDVTATHLAGHLFVLEPNRKA